MNKTDRINTMMRYINNRQYFTIRELTTQFHVSRSTVIRDLNTIQELGMPLTASVGRDGGYAVLQNQLLPAVQFNSEELKALFVSFLATLNTQLPYLQNRNTLTEKLVAIASQTQQDDLLTLQELLVFDHTNPRNPKLTELADHAPALLKPLLNACLTTRQLTVATAERTLTIWVRHVFSRQNNWYVDAWDLTHHQFVQLAIARLTRVTPIAKERALDPQAITLAIKHAQPQPNVQLRLNADAIQQFHQHPHPTAALQFRDAFQQTAVLDCFLEPTNAQQLADFGRWYLYLGAGARIIQAPAPLIAYLKESAQRLLADLPQ
ncbi:MULTISPECIES: YafY family protein [Lactobacillaceae]|uniref:helix-turn-helix transcriptional regulator n=1 Tax=Lactobacillaceae TaxID=33958 RepID=UPI001456AD6E|nr:HTH domain-containing protein [Lactobacillus sp. HBUAS51381]NLR10004.1 HTH domain-containing protein [Lactobacillus sp. HBUAS51381]